MTAATGESDAFVSLGARVKVPGEAMVGEAVDLLAQHLEGDGTTPYERLLGDALRGEATLFVREDEGSHAPTIAVTGRGAA